MQTTPIAVYMEIIVGWLALMNRIYMDCRCTACAE
jgi:hypothetical protein